MVRLVSPELSRTAPSSVHECHTGVSSERLKLLSNRAACSQVMPVSRGARALGALCLDERREPRERAIPLGRDAFEKATRFREAARVHAPSLLAPLTFDAARPAVASTPRCLVTARQGVRSNH